MTVKQLIEQLQQLPPELHLFTKGYEGGLCDAELLTDNIEDIALNYHNYWYYGPHELKSLVSDDNYQIVKGLIFKRIDNNKPNKTQDPYLQTK